MELGNQMHPATRIRAAMVAGALAISLGIGCNSRPTPIAIPKYDPQAFADSLLQRCDKDGNASLSKAEAAAAPGLLAGWSRYDTNGDQAISADELKARAAQWLSRREGLVSILCEVKLSGTPIEGVQVKLVPDEALAAAVSPAETVSRRDYPTDLSIPPDLRAEAHRRLGGMQYGLYRVEVSHPSMQLAPAPQSAGCDIGPSDQAKPLVIHVVQK